MAETPTQLVWHLAGRPARGCPFFHSNSEYPETWCTEPEYGRDWGMGYYDGGPAPKWCAFRQKGEDVVDDIMKRLGFERSV